MSEATLGQATAPAAARMSTRQVVLVLLFALAEASVIEPLILLLPTPLRLVDSGVALAVIWMVLGGIAFTRRFMAQRDAGVRAQRTALGVWLFGLLVAFFVIVTAVQQINPRSLSILLVEFVSVLVLWWRGSALGVTLLGPDSARLRLQIGLIIFVMFALATVFNREVNLLGFLMPFLVGALFAMPLSHIERVEQSPIGRHVPMDAKWWRSLGWGVALPLFAAISIALLLTGDTLADGLRLLVTIALIPILAVAAVFAFLIGIILTLLFQNMKQNPLEALQNLGDFMRGIPDRPEQPTPAVFEIPPDVRFVIGLVVVLGIAALLIYLTGRARREAAVVRDTGVDLLDLGEADGPPPPSSGGLLSTLSLRRWLAAVTIRRIYARMSHEAGKRGFARVPAQTPFDYLPRLGEAYPAVDADVRLITDAYVAAHYGQVPDTDEALAEIRAAWERVRATPRPVTLSAQKP
jgi:hypothetical protein